MTRVQVLLGNVFGLLVSFNYLSNERLAEHQMTFEDEMTCIKVKIFDTAKNILYNRKMMDRYIYNLDEAKIY